MQQIRAGGSFGHLKNHVGVEGLSALVGGVLKSIPHGECDEGDEKTEQNKRGRAAYAHFTHRMNELLVGSYVEIATETIQRTENRTVEENAEEGDEVDHTS